MPSRRSHQNSHHGCVQCKARKVKIIEYRRAYHRPHLQCDETRPVCNRCKKQGRPCDFSSFAPALAAQANVQSWPSSPGAYGSISSTTGYGDPQGLVPPSPNPSNVSSNGLKISSLLNSAPPSPTPNPNITVAQSQDLKLMHHWTLHAYKTIADRENVLNVWQEIVPKEAVNHTFLMHGLLALTALHLAYLGAVDRQYHIDIAQHHWSCAITLVQPALRNISHSNCNALFAFSNVAAVVAFAKPHVTRSSQAPQTPYADPIDDMLELISLLRGISAVVQNSYGWISQGPLRLMLRKVEAGAFELAPGLSAALDLLQTRSMELGDELQDACIDAIEKLRAYFRDQDIVMGEKGKIVAWPIMVKKEYLIALSNRDPTTMAIVAYWGVMVHGMRELWWAETWGKQVVGAISQMLDSSWEPCLQYAKEEVGVVLKDEFMS